MNLPWTMHSTESVFSIAAVWWGRSHHQLQIRYKLRGSDGCQCLFVAAIDWKIISRCLSRWRPQIFGIYVSLSSFFLFYCCSKYPEALYIIYVIIHTLVVVHYAFNIWSTIWSEHNFRNTFFTNIYLYDLIFTEHKQLLVNSYVYILFIQSFHCFRYNYIWFCPTLRIHFITFAKT